MKLNTVKGVVQYINENNGKFGVNYNIKVAGTAYYLGKVNPTEKYGISQGDTVQFSYETNSNGFNHIKGPIKRLAVVEAAKPQRPVPSAAAAARHTSESEKLRQEIISRQAAANTAIAFLELAQKANALPTPKSKADGFDALLAMFEKLRDEFFYYSMGMVNPPKEKGGEQNEEAKNEREESINNDDDFWE